MRRQHIGQGCNDQKADDDEKAKDGQLVGGEAPPDHIGTAEAGLCA